MTPESSLPSDSRREFVRKSLAASIIAAQPTLLAGLVRAEGGGGDTTGTTDPWETTYETSVETSEFTGTTEETTEETTAGPSMFKMNRCAPNKSTEIPSFGGLDFGTNAVVLFEPFTSDWNLYEGETNRQYMYQIDAVFWGPAKDNDWYSSDSPTFGAAAVLRMFQRSRTSAQDPWGQPDELTWNGTNQDWEPSQQSDPEPRNFPQHSRAANVICAATTGVITSSANGDKDSGPSGGMKTTIEIVAGGALVTGKASFTSEQMNSGEMVIELEYVSELK